MEGTNVISTKKLHIRICTGNMKNHGGYFRPVYVMPQMRVFLFFWRTMWDCPYCQDARKVEEWVRKSYPNAVITHGGWREFE